MRTPHKPPWVLSLAHYIVRCRMHIGWSQQELASKARIAPSTLWCIETGLTQNITVRTLIRISDALHVSPDFLLGINPHRSGKISGCGFCPRRVSSSTPIVMLPMARARKKSRPGSPDLRP